jgi:hypothetical protein
VNRSPLAMTCPVTETPAGRPARRVGAPHGLTPAERERLRRLSPVAQGLLVRVLDLFDGEITHVREMPEPATAESVRSGDVPGSRAEVSRGRRG